MGKLERLQRELEEFEAEGNTNMAALARSGIEIYHATVAQFEEISEVAEKLKDGLRQEVLDGSLSEEDCETQIQEQDRLLNELKEALGLGEDEE